jgi:hypothetical protein
MQKYWKIAFFIFLFFLLMACSAVPIQKRDKSTQKPTQTHVVDVGNQKFSGEGISFEYPGSWRTVEEIFGKPTGQTRDREFNAEILVTVTNAIPSPFGEKYTAWCSLMTRQPIIDQNLLNQMKGSYSILNNYPNSELSLNETEVEGNPAIEKIYSRPRGEPWYTVRDVWIETSNSVLILSCYSTPDNFEHNLPIFEAILSSMSFN